MSDSRRYAGLGYGPLTRSLIDGNAHDIATACKECGGMLTCMKGRADGEPWVPRGECKRLTAMAQRGRRHEMKGPRPDEDA